MIKTRFLSNNQQLSGNNTEKIISKISNDFQINPSKIESDNAIMNRDKIDDDSWDFNENTTT